MYDNAPYHMANIVSRELYIENVMRLQWPAHSPELNPNEQAWDILRRVMHDIHEQPQTLVTLENVLWTRCMAEPQNDLKMLIALVRRHIETCTEASATTDNNK